MSTVLTTTVTIADLKEANGVIKVVPTYTRAPRGLTPPGLSPDVHYTRSLAQLRSKGTPIDKNIFLSQLKGHDENMFYRLCLQHMAEITPLIYTPTVGDACLQYSQNWRRPEGLFISYQDKGHIVDVLKSWPRLDEARIAVVTDGSRILGLGDLGVNGMPISLGKLSLYVAGAGIRPQSTVPICLDLGTNNSTFLVDPLYLGLRRHRVSGAEMDAFMDELMAAMRTVFPRLLVQFEDFATDNAFRYLARFRSRGSAVFNDDIQGTGAVVLAGFVNAARLASAASGRPLSEHRILFLGAGSAGVGVAMQLMSFFRLQGLSEEEARDKIWLADSQGLVYDARGKLAEHKKYFSRKDYAGQPIKDLMDVIKHVRPTALLGLSTIGGIFTKEVIELMTELNPRPIVFPLSNPVSLSECTFSSALYHSQGTVLFASGSPFAPLEYYGRTYHAGQGNNMYIFPGLGLGALLCCTRAVSDSMVEAAALGLAGALTREERDEELLYPRLERIREISARIACAVIRAAQREGLDEEVVLRAMDEGGLLKHVKAKMWSPMVDEDTRARL